ncbi:MAG: hypothetical protein NZ531_03895 [Aquificaceae bacterium]|nr:hypothetical protein [Aquificaceae bacterium]
MMEKAGTYRFVLHFYDDYADSYKNHQVKAALEVNQPIKKPLADNYDLIQKQFRADIIAAFFQKKPYYGKDVNGNPKPAAPYAARANSAQSAGFIIGALPKDRIFFFYGHGLLGGGAIVTTTKMVWAKRCSDNCKCGEMFLEDVNMQECILAVFGACDSAKDSDHGNIALQAKLQGADAAVGFEGYGPGYYQDQPQSIHKIWAYHLWEALCRGERDDDTNALTCQPVCIEEALHYAMKKVWERFGNYWWTNNFKVYGNKQQKIIPIQ